MLSALKFVKGAVSTKDYVPALTHFQIKGGRVTGYNGKLSLSSPIPLDLDCCPKALPFVKAIEACTDTAQLAMTAGGKLAVRSGKFRAHVDTLPEEWPGVDPEGLHVAIDGQLLPTLTALYDFSSDDASRPWAAGVLLDGSSAFATNNVVLVERWLGYHFPYRVNLPRYAVRELIRIGEEPVGLQVSGGSATFFFEGERWLRTQLNSHEWPNVVGLFSGMAAEAAEVPEGLFDALATLAPFVDEAGRVYMLGDRVATATDANVGAAVELPGLPDAGIYNVKMLQLLSGVVDRIDFASYPQPCAMYGHQLRGLLMGMRL